MTAYYQTWVIDENNEDYRTQLALLKSYLKELQQINKTKLVNGLTCYKYLITDSMNEFYLLASQIIAQIGCDPLNLTIKYDKLYNITDLLRNVEDTVKNTLRDLYQIDVSYVDFIQYEHYYVIIPYDNDDLRIYLSTEQIGLVTNKCDLGSLTSNASYLTSDPSLMYALDHDKNVNSTGPLIKHNNSYLVSNDIDPELLYDLRVVSSAPLDKYVVLHGDDLDITTWVEIAHMWNFTVVDRSDTRLVLDKPHDFDWYPIPKWFQTSARAVRRGELPLVTLYGPWQLESIEQRPFINYAAHRTYINHNYQNIMDLHLNSDMSITARFGTYESCREYVQKLQDLYNNRSIWQIIPVDNLIDGIVKRYELGRYQENQNLLLFDDVMYIVSDVNVSDFSFVGKRNELEQDLRVFFSQCQNTYGFDINQLQQLSLEELIDIIYSDNRYNCFTKNIVDEATSLGLPLEPLLGHEYSVARYRNLTYALSGYFDYGPLSGIMSYSPSESMIDIDLSQTSIQASYKEQFETLSTPLIEMNVVTPDGIYSLLEVAYDDLMLAAEIVEYLWYKGWFVTEWARFYYNKTGHFCSALIRNNPLLTVGSYGYENGNMVLVILSRIAQALNTEDKVMIEQ